MIQDIAPHKFDLTYMRRQAGDSDFALCMENSRTLLKKTASGRKIPRLEELCRDMPGVREKAKTAYYLFAIDSDGYFYIDPAGLNIPEGYEFCDTSVFRHLAPRRQAFAGITATQLCRFKESHRFCGKCGHAMADSMTERAVVCPACGMVEYPKISPAVIIAITDGDRMVLTRYRPSPEHTYGGYALVAGYVEIGETLEDTLRREVMEEVGLKVKNIRYYKSQPWAFSDTEMVGFFAELDGDDRIRVEESELCEAKWHSRDDIPDEAVLNSIGSEMKMLFKYGSLERYYERAGR